MNGLPILNRKKNLKDGGFYAGRYTWGAWEIRKHSYRPSWVVTLENDICELVNKEFTTLDEVRKFLFEETPNLNEP